MLCLRQPVISAQPSRVVAPSILDDDQMSVKSASPKRQDVSNSDDKNKKAKNKPEKGST